MHLLCPSWKHCTSMYLGLFASDVNQGHFHSSHCQIIPISNLSLPQHLFTLISPTLGRLHNNARKQLLEGIKADEMSLYYKLVTSADALTSDPVLLESMEKDNEEELRKLDERLAEAEKQEGESEISDALKAKLEGTVTAQKLVLEKMPGLASRVDIALTLIQLGFFFSDNGLITENLLKTERFIEEGGGWGRHNRLKVYCGLHMASICQLKASGALLLNALSTFTATELTTYDGFLITAPEVISILPEIPIIGDLLNHLYDCHYAKIFVALATLEQTYLLLSRLLSPHTCYYVREIRILSYRSLTLESLSGAFGVSIEFVDRYTTWPSLKNVQYDKVIKQGNVLLNSIQRLRVLRLRDDSRRLRLET
ncbi:26S proteasome subunit RPN7-domain-containing protein [Suillus spraguei]|nr:26S proteasome subunit RPN7-domain-containing protein [Suillus spraguei]